MSKIGRKPVLLPEGVSAEVQEEKVLVKGPRGELEVKVPEGIKVTSEENQLRVSCLRHDKRTRACHGTVRSLLQNAVVGVTEGWRKELEVVGTGYRVAKEENCLVLTLGFSHPVKVEIPADLSVSVEENRIKIEGQDRQRVGLFASQVRHISPPDAYKGKGIRYADEEIKLKPGKIAKAGPAEGG